MVVGARDLPHARRRRWLYHGAVAVTVILTGWWAVTGLSRASRTEAAAAAAEERLRVNVAEADGVAADCGLEPFSGEASLERFPIQIPSYPTKREMDCANQVSRARAALIEEHLALRDLRPAAGEARRSARTRIWIAGLTALWWLVGLYVAELLPRRSAARRGAQRGSPEPPDGVEGGVGRG